MHDEENAFNNKMLILFQFFDDDTTLRKFSVSQVRWSTQANPRRHKITFRELKGQRDFNTQHISTFRAPLDFSRFSFTYPFFPSFLPPSLEQKREETDIFVSFPSSSFSLSFVLFFCRASIFGAVLRFKMYAKDRGTPRIPTRYTPRRKARAPLGPGVFLSRVFLSRLTSPAVTGGITEGVLEKSSGPMGRFRQTSSDDLALMQTRARRCCVFSSDCTGVQPA